jgi:hypothetical protein
MTRISPEILILNEENIVVGALQSIDVHTVIYANRAVAYGVDFKEGGSYQIKINTTLKNFSKVHCTSCGTEHYILKEAIDAGYQIIPVKLLGKSVPYQLNEDIFIYNDLKFICV